MARSGALRILTPPAIIDIEVSGFGAVSYPIEVGAVLHDGTRYCALILPQPEWTHWDEGAGKIHRISRDILQTASLQGNSGQ